MKNNNKIELVINKLLINKYKNKRNDCKFP